MKTGTRKGREALCPFCDSELPRPAEMTVGPGEKVSGGVCRCGAIYLLDPTGKGVGEMMAVGLGMVADALAKSVAQLVAGEDYDDVILSYDWRTHRSPGLSEGFMDGYGRLYVIRSKKRAA